MNEELGFVPSHGILRTDQKIVHGHLRTILTAHISSHSPARRDVKRGRSIESVQVGAIHKTEGSRINTSIGIAPEHLPAGSHLSHRKGRGRHDDRRNEEDEDDHSFGGDAYPFDGHYYKSTNFSPELC